MIHDFTNPENNKKLRKINTYIVFFMNENLTYPSNKKGVKNASYVC